MLSSTRIPSSLHLLCVALYFYSFSFIPATNAGTHRVDDGDARVRYFPDDVLPESTCKNNAGNPACDGHWWTESDGQDIGGGMHDTLGQGTWVELDFQGDSITLYGITLDRGARGFVTLDRGTPESISFEAPGGPNPGVMLFHKGGLNPNYIHTIRVSFDNQDYSEFQGNRKWLGIDAFEYTVPDEYDTSPTSASETASQSRTEQGTAGVQTGLYTPSQIAQMNKIGVYAAGFGAAMLFVVTIPAFWYWWRRRPEHPQSVSVSPQMKSLQSV